MFEKVNPSHPDKVADRIAGAITDLAYSLSECPKVATEVLIGHGVCTVIVETSERIKIRDVRKIVRRIDGKRNRCVIKIVSQDKHLADNQRGVIRCGDNGIFKGMPMTKEQKDLFAVVSAIYSHLKFDGKYLINGSTVTVCQSHAHDFLFSRFVVGKGLQLGNVNPLGYWTGGTNVDSGATNRKLGSDMGDAVTGGGLHGKDLSKADVSVNVWCHLMAQKYNKPIEAICEIGSDTVDTTLGHVPFVEIVNIASDYIRRIGGFERFAEWGLINYI